MQAGEAAVMPPAHLKSLPAHREYLLFTFDKNKKISGLPARGGAVILGAFIGINHRPPRTRGGAPHKGLHEFFGKHKKMAKSA